jgi:hypothetical protein
MWRWSRKELAAGVTPLTVGVLLVAFAAAACLTVAVGGVARSRAEPSCSQPIPSGSSERAAERVVDLFVRMRGCSAELATPQLKPALVASHLALYQSRYPDDVGAWYQLAPRIRNAAGLWEYAGFLYLEARDRPPAAFEFLLELHGDRWLMASFVLVDGNAVPSYPT